MIKTNVLGFPRIGEKRELKKAVESYWKGKISELELQKVAKNIRQVNWIIQKDAGIDFIPSNDFSFYDQILDASCLFGNIPKRFNHSGDKVSLETLFSFARGVAKEGSIGTCAGEMTKWFDTNYHYIVPEFSSVTNFSIKTSKIFDEFSEAKALSIKTKPVLIGPVTYLSLGKTVETDFDPLNLLDKLLVIYKKILIKLENQGATWIQIDEPIFALDLSQIQKDAIKKAYKEISIVTNLKIVLTSYFGELRDNLDLFVSQPVEALHFDAVRGRKEFEQILEKFPSDKIMSIGIIDGRNIWKNDYKRSNDLISKAINRLGEDNIWIASSCSLMHSPISLSNEDNLDGEIKDWLAFATEKIEEIIALKNIANGNGVTQLNNNIKSMINKKNSTRIHNKEVKQRCSQVTIADSNRKNYFSVRQALQKKVLDLPLFPVTTIGSFPQNTKIRQKRAAFKKGTLSAIDYDSFLKEETKRAVKFQEEIEIDMFVHGEFERNDMVEYFGEQLEGFIFTQFGWVQSYGSRCVKPPIIFGDVSRPKPMTVYWSKYAKSLTDKPMKGMLTGPVTILQWSFVRNDQERSKTTKQIALAIRDEVSDLEKAGMAAIQVDEPAFREGLPLRKSDWQVYLDWASKCFKLSTCSVEDKTQIHTHMCYCEFNDIIDDIAGLDADVISIETSRSNMELLDSFVDYKYPNEIGPGIYDIHSPRIPTKDDMYNLIKKASQLLPATNLWVNPDCGLKTRGWKETREALINLVNAAKTMR